MAIDNRIDEVMSGQIPPKMLAAVIAARVPPKMLAESLRKARQENRNRMMDEELKRIHLHYKVKVRDRRERAHLILAGVGAAYLVAFHYAWATGCIHKTVETVNELAYNFLHQGYW